MMKSFRWLFIIISCGWLYSCTKSLPEKTPLNEFYDEQGFLTKTFVIPSGQRFVGALDTISIRKLDKISTIIIQGDINAEDISYIRNTTLKKYFDHYLLGNLSTIDLSLANIKAGPFPYFSDDATYNAGGGNHPVGKRFITEDNIIPKLLFHSWRVSTLILPKSLKGFSGQPFAWDDEVSTIVFSEPDGTPYIETLRDSLFYDARSVKNVTLHSRLNSLEDYVFHFSVTITSLNPVPPNCKETSLGSSEYIKLYVPRQSLQAYSNHPIWGTCHTIREIEER